MRAGMKTRKVRMSDQSDVKKMKKPNRLLVAVGAAKSGNPAKMVVM
jgi:hypothetical protein